MTIGMLASSMPTASAGPVCVYTDPAGVEYDSPDCGVSKLSFQVGFRDGMPFVIVCINGDCPVRFYYVKED